MAGLSAFLGMIYVFSGCYGVRLETCECVSDSLLMRGGYHWYGYCCGRLCVDRYLPRFMTPFVYFVGFKYLKDDVTHGNFLCGSLRTMSG